jgi:hypothetical protein
MVDMASISAAVSSLKTAADIAKAILDLKTSAEIQGRVIELQTLIVTAQASAISAQSDQFTLLQRVNELEAKLARLEAWEAEKSRYQLTDYGGGTFAYALKIEARAGEPDHRICAHCYQHGKKSILQFEGTSEGQDYYNCPNCKIRFAFGIYRPTPLSPMQHDYF